MGRIKSEQTVCAMVDPDISIAAPIIHCQTNKKYFTRPPSCQLEYSFMKSLLLIGQGFEYNRSNLYL